MDENRTADAEPRIISVEAPYFESLKAEPIFSGARAAALTTGHAAFREALFGDRRRPPRPAQRTVAPGWVVEFHTRGQQIR